MLALGLLWTTIIGSILLDLRSSSREEELPRPVGRFTASPQPCISPDVRHKRRPRHGTLQHHVTAVKASNDGNARIRSGAEIFAPCRQFSCTMRWLIRVLTILFLSLFLS